jgi:carboxyl-terminal processing protease
MKKNKIIFLAFLLSAIVSFQIGCVKDEIIVKPQSQPITKTDSLNELNFQINKFIWENMHDYYLWTENVSKLNLLGENITALERSTTDHEKFFDDLLYQKDVIDKYSWIVDDYVALQNEFHGISKSYGMYFNLFYYNSSNDVLGTIRFVIKGSPADLAGLKRGDIFTKIDDEIITKSNYITLLSKETMTLSLATMTSTSSEYVANLTGKNVTISTAEVVENPIFRDTVIVENNVKIGYFCYNGFMNNFNQELNNVFAKFKQAGIQKLVLDLRYNPGGHIETAISLTSMIYGTNTSDICVKIKYNKYIEKYLSDSKMLEELNRKFTDSINISENTKIAINRLNLKDIYILTSRGTASASELVINSLKPYINVTLIGTNTYGKCYGSATLYDYIDENTINPNHTWAIQPIILKYSNKNDYSDFTNGFTPNYEVSEDFVNILELGNPNELLFRKALDLISGKKSGKISNIDSNVRAFKDSKDLIPHGKELYTKIK